MYEGRQVAHHDAADLDHTQLDARGTAFAVRGVDLNRIIVRRRTNAEASRVARAQRDVRGAGVDDKVEAAAVDARLHLEVAAVVDLQPDGAIAVGDLRRGRLRVRRRGGARARTEVQKLVDRLQHHRADHSGDAKKDDYCSHGFPHGCRAATVDSSSVRSVLSPYCFESSLRI